MQTDDVGLVEELVEGGDATVGDWGFAVRVLGGPFEGGGGWGVDQDGGVVGAL
jgi:hypothetical protein